MHEISENEKKSTKHREKNYRWRDSLDPFNFNITEAMSTFLNLIAMAFINNTSVLRIRDVYPGSEFFSSSRIWIFFIPDPGSASKKELKYFNQKNCFYAVGNTIRVVHPGSGSWILELDFLPIPDPRVKKAADTGSRIRIRNTVSPCDYCILI